MHVCCVVCVCGCVYKKQPETNIYCLKSMPWLTFKNNFASHYIYMLVSSLLSFQSPLWEEYYKWFYDGKNKCR